MLSGEIKRNQKCIFQFSRGQRKSGGRARTVLQARLFYQLQSKRISNADEKDRIRLGRNQIKKKEFVSFILHITEIRRSTYTSHYIFRIVYSVLYNILRITEYAVNARLEGTENSR